MDKGIRAKFGLICIKMNNLNVRPESFCFVGFLFVNLRTNAHWIYCIIVSVKVGSCAFDREEKND